MQAISKQYKPLKGIICLSEALLWSGWTTIDTTSSV
nr:MAG TPA: hypothetical protein [Caudoviricetes sp.]